MDGERAEQAGVLERAREPELGAPLRSPTGHVDALEDDRAFVGR